MDLKQYIRSIPDYPKKGILFRDITTLIKEPKAFNFAIDKIIEISKNKLNNGNFIQKAPKDIIDKEKELLKSNSLELDKLKEIINTVV